MASRRMSASTITLQFVLVVLSTLMYVTSAARIPGILSSFSAVFRTDETCQAHSVPICTRFGYNMTKMPNFLNHQTQQEASAELLGGYCKLIETECSAELPFLLCSYHLPICVPTLRYPVVPCKSLCRRVKKACRPILERANYSWPESLDCSALPSKSTEDEHGPLVVCVNSVNDMTPSQPFCGAPPTTPPPPPPCPAPTSCSLNKPKKKFFCKHYHGWAVQGNVLEETVSEGRHAYIVRVSRLLFSEVNGLLNEEMFERDASGHFNLTIHTGQPSRCDKCPTLTVNRNKAMILAGELSETAPHILLRPPVASGSGSKTQLLKKVPKHMRKCNRKHRARSL